jgi:hypothetical protein
VAAGFILGLLLVRRITGLRLSTGDLLRRLSVAAAVGILVLGTGVSVAKYAASRLTGEGLYAATVHWMGPGEDRANDRWIELSRLARANKRDGATYANDIEREVTSFWREAQVRLAKIELPITSPAYEGLQLLKTVTAGRLHAYALVADGLRKDDEKIAAIGLEELKRIDHPIEEHEKAR